jgi:uncharacterized protein YkwD
LKRALWKLAVPLSLSGLIVLGLSVSQALAAVSPLPVNYKPTPVVVQPGSQPAPSPTPAPTPTPPVPTPTPTPMPVPSPVAPSNPAGPLPVNYKPGTVVIQPGSQPAPSPTPAPTPTPPVPTPTPVPAPQPAPAGLTANETALYNLINSDRANAGVAPVSINMNAVAAARAKAQDMIANNYFGHQSPTYGSPGQLLTRYGVSYRSYGENIAMVQNVYIADASFLTSTAGHREIMLDPKYNQVGVGVIPRGSYVVVVEEFIQT